MKFWLEQITVHRALIEAPSRAAVETYAGGVDFVALELEPTYETTITPVGTHPRLEGTQQPPHVTIDEAGNEVIPEAGADAVPEAKGDGAIDA